MSTSTQSNVFQLQRSETLLSVALLSIMVVMLVPLPSFLLDLLLATNLAACTLLLLIALGTRKALDFSVFPSLLLLMTLYRLALNVATTRLILLAGDAGRIVDSFGHFVVGGNLVVGLVIFLILVIIQFVVITKGAGRISEVAARFTLDALPGKQMSIDAEMNAGVLTEHEARSKREELSRETEFYGAMDGASKFVRGDAIAGLIVTAINLIGGMVIGMSNGLSLSASATRYSILTIGDGLVSQIPALIIAITAGILVTKTSSDEALGTELETQLLKNERPLWIGVAMLVLIAMVPGLPKLPFLGLAAALLVVLTRNRPVDIPSESPDTPGPDPDSPDGTDDIEDLREFLSTDRAIVEVGARLVPFIKSSRQKGLADRVTALRREFSNSRGQWVPPIRIRSNLDLGAEDYRVLVAGRQVAAGTVRSQLMLAISPNNSATPLPGEKTNEPTFGLPAIWIDPGIRRQAESHGYTVVDPVSVIITHLGELLRKHGHEMITREVVKEMLEQVKDFAPTIVEELKSENVRTGLLQQVLVQLAADRLRLSELTVVLEAIANHAATTKSPNDLTDRVREDLGWLVCERFQDDHGRVRVFAFEPRLEMRLKESLRDGQLALGPGPLEKLLGAVSEQWQNAQRRQEEIGLLTDRSLRRPLRRLLARSIPDLGLLTYQEVPSEALIDPAALIGLAEVFENESTVETPAKPPAHPAAGVAA